jgi:triphosphatase
MYFSRRQKQQMKSVFGALFGYNVESMIIEVALMLEVELKFQIPEGRRTALMKALDPKKSEQLQLQAKYYDTPNKHLATAQAALRQRLEGEYWVQTFKASRSHLARFEHNHDLGMLATAPDLDLTVYAADSEAEQLLHAALGDQVDQLQLIFETDIARTLRVIAFGDSEIEVSLDIGEIRAQGRVHAVHEIEFELKRGNVQDLLSFSFEWVKKYQLWLDVRSKAEFGNLLAENLSVSPTKHAKDITLSKKETADHNVRHLVAQHMQHLLPNIAAMSAGVATDTHIQQAHLALHHLHFTVLLFKSWSPDISDKWAHQLAAFKGQFEQLKHLQHMQSTLNKLLQNPKTSASLSQDILYATEKLNNLVRSTQNVHHFLELLMFSLAEASSNSALDFKSTAQNTLQQHYKYLQDALNGARLDNLASLEPLTQAIQQLKFSFPLLTQIYDVKNLQKYGKALNDAELAAEEYNLLSLASEYLQETELAASDWFVLGWLTAKQEVYAERLLDATQQFLVSRKFLK